MAAFSKGIAFIFEGPTEKVFYSVLLTRLCEKHPGFHFEKVNDNNTGEVFYILKNESFQTLIKMDTVGTVSQITNSGVWFGAKCYTEHKKLDWTVILCYDTDEYLSSYSKFQKGDWENLRKTLQKNKASIIIDMASSADIEDTMLLDSESVFKFLQLPVGPLPSGKKGKSKMKKLFRMKGRGWAYHSGEKARPLIESLNYDVIIDKSPMPFCALEEVCFS